MSRAPEPHLGVPRLANAAERAPQQRRRAHVSRARFCRRPSQGGGRPPAWRWLVCLRPPQPHRVTAGASRQTLPCTRDTTVAFLLPPSTSRSGRLPCNPRKRPPAPARGASHQLRHHISQVLAGVLDKRVDAELYIREHSKRLTRPSARPRRLTGLDHVVTDGPGPRYSERCAKSLAATHSRQLLGPVIAGARVRAADGTAGRLGASQQWHWPWRAA